MTSFGSDALERIVGRSALIRAEIEKCVRYCGHRLPVLIYGETGTGKEIFARTIHEHDPNAAGPFVAVNCGGIPENLIESHLFGHEAGAFTGATRRQTGLVEHADGGTLFLDEINSLPLLSQGKLLRFLQEKEYRRVGATDVRRARARVVSATNVDLTKAVSLGTFRPDLLFRLNVFTLNLPPLRERPEDIPTIARHLIARDCTESQPVPRQFTARAVQRLMSYSWPGNARELENVIQRSLALCSHEVLDESDLDLPANGFCALPGQGYKAQKDRANYQWEDWYLRDLIAQHPGNISEAARAAGLDRKSIYRLLQKHGLRASGISACPVEHLSRH